MRIEKEKEMLKFNEIIQSISRDLEEKKEENLNGDD